MIFDQLETRPGAAVVMLTGPLGQQRVARGEAGEREDPVLQIGQVSPNGWRTTIEPVSDFVDGVSELAGNKNLKLSARQTGDVTVGENRMQPLRIKEHITPRRIIPTRWYAILNEGSKDVNEQSVKGHT